MARKRPGVLVLKRSDGREERIDLCQDVTTLGRSEVSTVTLPLPTVSRLHARIELQHDRYVLYDAGSANGTYINGKRIQHDCPLRMGDEIWIGSSDATLIFDDPEATIVLPFNAGAPLFIDERAHGVRVYGVPVALSPLEYGLLLHLAKNPGTVCTRSSCFLSVWGHVYDHATCEDAVNNCVAKLRRNLGAAAEANGMPPLQVTTIPRTGFRLDVDVVFAPPRARRCLTTLRDHVCQRAHFLPTATMSV